MTSINSKVLVVLLIIGMAAIPALGNSGGPPYLNQDGDPTVKYGCSCHNNGAVSERAVVMITSVPIMYELGESYELTIKVADSLTLSGGDGNSKAGFMLSSDSMGVFSWNDDQEIRIAADTEADISHLKEVGYEEEFLDVKQGVTDYLDKLESWPKNEP